MSRPRRLLPQSRGRAPWMIALAMLVLALGAWRQYGEGRLGAAAFVAPAPAQTSDAPGVLGGELSLREWSRQDIPMPGATPAAHASFLLADTVQGQQRLRAFWFAGSRESGPDVQIVMSQWLQGGWTAPVIVVNRQAVFQQLGLGGWVRRLGNPVAWVDAQGRTHLYVVATGLGGWSASRILHLVQAKPESVTQTAMEFVPMGFLQLSPFFNLSHLVRGAPMALQDGGVLLPAYFEMGIKYPVAIRLDGDGNLVRSRDAVVRMAGNLKSLQPTVVVHSEHKALAYLRDNSDEKKLRFVQTHDAGKSWETLPSGVGSVTDAGADWVINPDSSPAAIDVAGHTLLIHNPQTSGRHRLVIEASVNGLRGWRRLATLEYEPERLDDVMFNEYSYPSAVLLGDQLHVSYTYRRQFIRHVVLQVVRKGRA